MMTIDWIILCVAIVVWCNVWFFLWILNGVHCEAIAMRKENPQSRNARKGASLVEYALLLLLVVLAGLAALALFGNGISTMLVNAAKII